VAFGWQLELVGFTVLVLRTPGSCSKTSLPQRNDELHRSWYCFSVCTLQYLVKRRSLSPKEESLRTSAIRVLVVEDYEPFRRFVVSILQQQPELQVICEVSDGAEAVRKTQELQPDLILLDIGLPLLNGIEVARQISDRHPQSTVLFVSQENSSDIVQGALATGAKGYVVKTDVGNELLVAVNAVLRGERFLSSSLASRDFSDSKDEDTGDHPGRKKVAPLPPRNVAIRHEVAFYPDNAALLDGFARVAEAALNVGNAVIILATEPHRSGILQRLRADAVDVETALRQDRLIQVDTLDTLSAVMVNNLPDRK
jgi:DNA-binding NarL/FixJ family response regulator